MFIGKFGDQLVFKCERCGVLYASTVGEGILPIEAELCQRCFAETTTRKQRTELFIKSLLEN